MLYNSQKQSALNFNLCEMPIYLVRRQSSRMGSMEAFATSWPLFGGPVNQTLVSVSFGALLAMVTAFVVQRVHSY